ncbi:hypothetical protein [Methylomonas koyamae]|uniref:hypothetical protein n=1 Tax=Methylomonas koyamae TaxID=702114 RepID=UPI0006D27BB9|nr:hypothetical protein [Methylomonas koyamae]
MSGFGPKRLVGILLLGLAGCADMAVIDGTLVFKGGDWACVGSVEVPAAGLELSTMSNWSKLPAAHPEKASCAPARSIWCSKR